MPELLRVQRRYRTYLGANCNSLMINSLPGVKRRSFATKISFSDAEAFTARFLIASTAFFRFRRRRSSRSLSLPMFVSVEGDWVDWCFDWVESDNLKQDF